MEDRAAKLALARKKLKDHQEKKIVQKDDNYVKSDLDINPENSTNSVQELSVQNIEEFIINPNNEIVEEVYAEPSVLGPENNANLIPHHTMDIKQTDIAEVYPHPHPPPTDISITEILISSKRNLELQVYELQSKLVQVEHNHSIALNNFKVCNQRVIDLEKEFQNLNNKYQQTIQEIIMKDTTINELNNWKSTLTEENNNLLEQLEFTKTILNSKEAESDSLHTQLYNLQSQYDVIHLQLQQLTNGSPAVASYEKVAGAERNEALLRKIESLEQQLSLSQKERDQMNLHYEHYVAQVNEQLQSALKNNEQLANEVQDLSNRENSLVEQISDMEIRIQNYNVDKKRFEMDQNTSNIKALQDNLQHVQEQLNELQAKYQQLQTNYAESEAKVKELSEKKESSCNHDNISISKLSADMTSDKVAAQRATEQNKKLKQDIQGLEDAFVKMSKDKLELTEKLTAEKYLNRELTIKLAEVEEKANDMIRKLKAKDEEMIRLQSNYREVEKQREQLKEAEKSSVTSAPEEIAEVAEASLDNNNIEPESGSEDTRGSEECLPEKVCLNSLRLQKEDAMSKLQERFLKIMGEVADLSDEKHRLEHIILQLQNETDTICEYVALYQQQRSLLKKRDEERSAQLKVFQQECGKLKCELEELSGILARFADDKELLSYFQIETRRNDMEKVMTLLTNLRNNSLIDPRKKNIEFNNFYPCNCCSGKLIDV